MRIFLFWILLMLSPLAITFGQTVYQDSLTTSFSINTSFSRTSESQVFGYGVNLAFKNGVNLGLIRTSQKDLSTADSQERRNGKGWGGFLSMMVANEFKGDPLGVEFGFIFSSATFRQESMPDYELKTEQIGTSLSISKKWRVSDYSLIVPQLGYSFFPISKVRENNGSRLDYVAYKTSTIAFNVGFTRDKNTFSYVIDGSIALDTNTRIFQGAVGLTIFP